MTVWWKYRLTKDCVVVVLFQHRTVLLEYKLTQDCVVVVLFQHSTSLHRTVWWEYRLTKDIVVGQQVNKGLCGGSTVSTQAGLCGWSTG